MVFELNKGISKFCIFISSSPEPTHFPQAVGIITGPIETVNASVFRVEIKPWKALRINNQSRFLIDSTAVLLNDVTNSSGNHHCLPYDDDHGHHYVR